MKISSLLLLLALTGCSAYKGIVVEPIHAIKLCGKSGVQDYRGLAGIVICNRGK